MQTSNAVDETDNNDDSSTSNEQNSSSLETHTIGKINQLNDAISTQGEHREVIYDCAGPCLLPLSAKPSSISVRRRSSNGSNYSSEQPQDQVRREIGSDTQTSMLMMTTTIASVEDPPISSFNTTDVSALLGNADEIAPLCNTYEGGFVMEIEKNGAGVRSRRSNNTNDHGEIQDIVSYSIICFVILIGDTARGITFPTLWLLVQRLGGKESTQGLVVAAFSFGRVFASPTFGRWSIAKGYLSTLRISIIVLMIGAILYSSSNSTPLLIFSQIVMGVGSGTLGVTRAYVAEVTSKESRTKYMAFSTAVQYAGFTVTPVIGAVFSSYLSGNSDKEEGFAINEFNAPAFFIVVLCIVALILLHTTFHDRIPKKKVEHDKTVLALQTVEESQLLVDRCPSCIVGYLSNLTVYALAMIVCMLLNVVTKGSIACFETIGIKTAVAQFGLTSSAAGMVVSSCGSFGVVALLSMAYIQMRLSDVQMIIFGIVVMIIGMSFLVFAEYFRFPGSWGFVLAIFLVYSIGYPIGHTAAMGLFSKIIGRRPQGELMGWFASSGSIARITFPILAGVLKGNSTLFFILIAVLSASVFFVRSMDIILTTLSS